MEPLKSNSVLLTAAAAVVIAGLASAASASTVIYQDNFTGNNSTPLNGTAPTTDIGPSTTWTANTYNVWASSGYTNYTLDQSTKERDSAFLNFTPSSGNIYTLSATITLSSGDPNGGTSTNNPNDWLALGFPGGISSGANTVAGGGVSLLNTGWDWGSNISPLDASPWAFIRLGGSGSYFTGPSTNGSGNFATTGGNVANKLSIVLNTENTTWTYQVFDNGTAVSKLITFSTNPNITAVGLQSAGVIGTVSDFELSSSPVPEPATLGLMAAGVLGLGLAGRRRKTA